jgi:holo-[acyl-carrier protein] synthase
MFIGTDIEDIERFESLEKQFISKVFSKKEISYCLSTKKPAEHFAVRFAAKEAIIKAFNQAGCRIGLDLCDIEILKDNKGVPFAKLHTDKHDKLNKYTVRISMSHSRNMALAFAIVFQKN